MADSVLALGSWLTKQNSISQIVLIDNSGHPLDELQQVADSLADKQQQVEFLSFKTQGYSRAKGRSFGELDILRHGISNSTLMGNCTHFTKANARVFVPNFDKILTRLPTDFDVVGNLSHNLTWLETILVFFRKSLFRDRLLPSAIDAVDDSRFRYIERVLAQETLRCIADDYRWYPLPREPLFQGVRGLDGQPYPGNRSRAALIDFFEWGFHRARDTTQTRKQPHAQDRWTPTGDDPDEPNGQKGR
jgi:hypothetical protein